MIEDLRSSIETLSYSEAKNLLLNMMVRINQIKETGESQEQGINHLFSLYDKVMSFHQHSKLFEREYETVHIVCGESPAGALRVGLGRKNLVIGFPDFFAIGPLWQLHVEEGWRYRYEWLQDHINVPENYIEEEYQVRFLNTLGKINAIPEKLPIIIWSAENPNEQIGYRYLLQLLKDKPNKIYMINATRAYQKLSNASHDKNIYKQTGELHPEKLNLIYKYNMTHPLSEDECGRIQDEWETLAKTKDVLRIWDGNRIKNVGEDYYDQLIVTTLRELHKDQTVKDFIRSARIIGQALIRSNGDVSDSFLEYRIRVLVYNGIFEIKGIPKGMRYYSVKLRV